MKQIGSDGKFVNSPSPSPKDSPNHIVVKEGEAGAYQKVTGKPERGEDEGVGDKARKGMNFEALVKQIELVGLNTNIQGLCDISTVRTCMYSHMNDNIIGIPPIVTS